MCSCAPVVIVQAICAQLILLLVAGVPPLSFRHSLRFSLRQLHRLRPENIHLPFCFRSRLRQFSQVLQKVRLGYFSTAVLFPSVIDIAGIINLYNTIFYDRNEALYKEATTTSTSTTTTTPSTTSANPQPSANGGGSRHGGNVGRRRRPYYRRRRPMYEYYYDDEEYVEPAEYYEDDMASVNHRRNPSRKQSKG